MSIRLCPEVKTRRAAAQSAAEKRRILELQGHAIALLESGVTIADLGTKPDHPAGVNKANVRYWRSTSPAFDQRVDQIIRKRFADRRDGYRARTIETAKLIVTSLRAGNSVQSLVRSGQIKQHTVAHMRRDFPDIGLIMHRAIDRYSDRHTANIKRRDEWRDPITGMATTEAQRSLVAAIEGGLRLSDSKALSTGGHPSEGSLLRMRSKSRPFDRLIISAVRMRDKMERNRRIMFGEGAAPAVIAPTVKRVDPERVYFMAMQAVPRDYPKHMRDDLISAVVIAVLEGRIQPDEMAAEVRRQNTAYWRERPEYRFKSLDATTFDDGKGSLHDTISRGLWGEADG